MAKALQLRIRITSHTEGEIDGIDLGTFDEGLTYEVAPTLGACLVTMGVAEFADPNIAVAGPPASEIRVQRLSEKLRAAASDSRHKSSNPAIVVLPPKNVR